MARQHRSTDKNSSAQQFSLVLPFTYAHMARKCRRILLELFGEDSVAFVCPEYCCDVCEIPTVVQEDRISELSSLIQAVAIDELKSMGEVKVTEWVRGGEFAWMQKIEKGNPFAHGSSPPNLFKEGGWRMLIRRASATGFILRSVKLATFGTSIQGAYALLQPTQKG